MSLQDKIQQLKKNQDQRISKTVDYLVEEWGETIKIRRLNTQDQIRAESWARKNFRVKPEIATGCALVCMAITEDVLPLSVESVNFLLGEPVEVITGLLDAIKKASEV